MNKLYRFISSMLVIIVTAVLYILLVDNFFKIPMAYISFSSVLLSELITFACFTFIKDNVKGLLMSAVFAIQTVLTIVVSLLFINVFVFSYTAFTVIYIVSLALAIIISVFILSQKMAIDNNNKEFKNAKISALSMRAVVNELLGAEDAKPYLAELNRLEEDIRFMDDSVTDELDGNIYDAICELQNNLSDEDFDVSKAIEKIKNLIKQRNFIVKNKKSYK